MGRALEVDATKVEEGAAELEVDTAEDVGTAELLDILDELEVDDDDDDDVDEEVDVDEVEVLEGAADEVAATLTLASTSELPLELPEYVRIVAC